jgi:tetraacyldisaccharide 4'-kinase
MTPSPAARPLLRPFVPAYRLALALREFQLRAGLRPIHRLRWPVVSIGNLSTGGTGKTPLTIGLVRALTAHGLYVDVLSRGYGRRSALPLRVDPRGNTQDFGDEPLLITRGASVPVYVAAQRYQAGLLAEAEAPQNDGKSHRLKAHILDDGFQHRQLARDIDILLLSRADLTDHLLPAGNLREALGAAYRADVIAIPADETDVEEKIKSRGGSRGWQGTIWRLRRRMEIPSLGDPTGGLADGLAAAFCGIGRPAQFFEGLESNGVKLAARIVFPDHHRYTARDLNRLTTEARRGGAKALITTEKDRVRLGSLGATLPESIPLITAQVRIEIEDEDKTVDCLIGRIAAIR